MSAEISVGWYGQTDATFTDNGSELVYGFGGHNREFPLTASQANTVLKHLDRDVGNQIIESAFFTRIPISASFIDPLSAVDLGDGRIAYCLASGGTFKTWTPAGEIDPSWTALDGGGVGTVGTLLDEGEAIWWNNSTTNSALSVVYRISNFGTGGSMTNGTTSATKAYRNFVKDAYGNYYRISNANVLQWATSLGGSWSDVAAVSSTVAIAKWGSYIVAVRTSLNAANAIAVLDNGVLIDSSNPGIGGGANPRACCIVEDRLIVYGVSGANINNMYLSAFGDPTNLAVTPKLAGTGFAQNAGSIRLGVDGSVVGVNLLEGFAYSPDRGESWKLTAATACCLESGRLYSGRGTSFRI